jgi:hypothetical protein
VPDLDDRRQVALAGGFAEFRYLAIERTSSNPLAVTLAVEPTFRRIDETGGERIRNFELETTINADLELVKNRLFAGFNFLYEPEVTRTALSETEREAKLGGSAALAWRVTPDVVIGGEVWYLRHYDSFGLQDFTGDAVMLGPTLYVRLAPKMFMTAAWNTQVWVAKSAIRFRSISPSFSATVHGSSSPSNSDIQHRRYPHVICTHCSSPFGGLRYCDRMEGKP